MQHWHIQLGLAVDQIHGTYHTVKRVDKLREKFQAAQEIMENPKKYKDYQVRWARNFLIKNEPV